MFLEKCLYKYGWFSRDILIYFDDVLCITTAQFKLSFFDHFQSWDVGRPVPEEGPVIP